MPAFCDALREAAAAFSNGYDAGMGAQRPGYDTVRIFFYFLMVYI